jgi:ABC-type bacteriocin/lantibiotic exporter with double-glycine peptidase domain
MKKCHAGIVVCAILFASAYKLTAWHYFSGQPRLITECATSYGGVASGRWGGFVQNGEETCGHAAPAFFLSCLEFPATEASIIEETGTASMLSLIDMERVFARRGLRTQALYVEPGYFKKQPVATILHFSSQHFIVFLKEENGEPVIFDPAYGQVFVPWKALLPILSGYMLYVYQ